MIFLLLVRMLNFWSQFHFITLQFKAKERVYLEGSKYFNSICDNAIVNFIAIRFL